MFANRMKNWERGTPSKRHTTPKNAAQRLKDFRAGAYMQTLLRDPAAGIMHSLIYFGFLVLLAVTTVLEIDHQMPEELSSFTAPHIRPTRSSVTLPGWFSSPELSGR